MPITITYEIDLTHQAPGPNQPCYCGSGKKYKKCHQPLDEARHRLLQTKGEIARKLSEWLSEQSWFQDLCMATYQRSFGRKSIEVEPMDLNGFSEAVAYEGNSEGQTPLERFIQEAALTPAEKQLYTRWRHESRFSFFEVTDVRLGQSLTLRDLFGQKTYTVLEKVGTYELTRGSILISRVAPVTDDLWMLTGAYSTMYVDSEEIQQALHRAHSLVKSSTHLSELLYIVTSLK